MVGARDESTLPLVWWQNVLCTFQTTHHLQIEMLGPEISSKWDKQCVSYTAPHDDDFPTGKKNAGKELAISQLTVHCSSSIAHYSLLIPLMHYVFSAEC